MRAAGVALLVGLAAIAAGCDHPGPIGPSPRAVRSTVSEADGDSPAISSPPHGRTAIRLTNPSVRASTWVPDGGYLHFVYTAEAVLEETSGLVGARVTAVRLESPPKSPGGPDRSEGREGACWSRTIRVEAGGTLELASWDQGLGYCMPDMVSPVALPYVVLVVTYVDDDGQGGLVSTQLDVAD